MNTKNRKRIAWQALAGWALLVAVLAISGHPDWAIFLGFATPGLLFGIGRAATANANRLSAVGVHGPGGLACPKCGGTSFTAKRSAGGKVGLGVLAPKTRVRCVTCGAQYTRG